MGNKKQTARKQNKHFLSVGPITSREEIGPTPKMTNLRTAMQTALRYALEKEARVQKEIKRLNALIKAYGKQR